MAPATPRSQQEPTGFGRSFSDRARNLSRSMEQTVKRLQDAVQSINGRTSPRISKSHSSPRPSPTGAYHHILRRMNDKQKDLLCHEAFRATVIEELKRELREEVVARLEEELEEPIIEALVDELDGKVLAVLKELWAEHPPDKLREQMQQRLRQEMTPLVREQLAVELREEAQQRLRQERDQPVKELGVHVLPKVGQPFRRELESTVGADLHPEVQREMGSEAASAASDQSPETLKRKRSERDEEDGVMAGEAEFSTERRRRSLGTPMPSTQPASPRKNTPSGQHEALRTQAPSAIPDLSSQAEQDARPKPPVRRPQGMPEELSCREESVSRNNADKLERNDIDELGKSSAGEAGRRLAEQLKRSSPWDAGPGTSSAGKRATSDVKEPDWSRSGEPGTDDNRSDPDNGSNGPVGIEEVDDDDIDGDDDDEPADGEVIEERDDEVLPEERKTSNQDVVIGDAAVDASDPMDLADVDDNKGDMDGDSEDGDNDEPEPAAAVVADSRTRVVMSGSVLVSYPGVELGDVRWEGRPVGDLEMDEGVDDDDGDLEMDDGDGDDDDDEEDVGRLGYSSEAEDAYEEGASAETPIDLCDSSSDDMDEMDEMEPEPGLELDPDQTQSLGSVPRPLYETAADDPGAMDADDAEGEEHEDLEEGGALR
ncbi:MAG: hypothetical protein M1826_005748 [Phylliscum demangeonii]|nr:MAG: hypothetical protein M1826_005748 [Phylliscum demangeonii]